jgi:secreted PhoX family phosphatase
MKSRDNDPICNRNPRPDFPDFSTVLAQNASRRCFLQAAAGSALLTALGMPEWVSAAGRPAAPAIGFVSLVAGSEDSVRIPVGYNLQLLYAWGDPISDGPPFRADASNSAADQAQQAGMHHDGMHFFPFVENGRPSSSHGLMCINHEYTDDGLLHTDGMATWSAEKTFKSQNAHGVSVIEVRYEKGTWRVVRPSTYARRITARTPIRISGPAAGSSALRTKDDRRGNVVFGTINNCAMGVTPWGTYLTCEENFNGYFNGLDAPTPEQKRYGIRRNGSGMRWHEHDGRFDLATEPNEANRFGWVVEIDPWNPAKPPVKRTALGRFKHEGATVTLASDGRVVVYMGDDEAFEYVYKFVSQEAFDPKKPSSDLLDRGSLHVARFLADGKGEWVELTHGRNGLDEKAGFADQADVLVRARMAADIVGATRMDRPEWIAVHPVSGEAYCSLTNNGKRSADSVDAANPRAANRFGHIIRWRATNGDAAASGFEWDVFVLGGNPAHPDEAKRGTIKGDGFGSPDGLWFDADGRLWIQTDVSTGNLNKGDYEGLGNNQMLVADINTGETRRFLSGPRGCEVTGITRTPDGTTLFVNIQHPGETAGARSDPANPTAVSAWPANQFKEATGGRPRSATLAITRQNGGVVGA